jgi:hypothetical protein
VAPLGAEPIPADDEGPSVEIYIGPHQPERFALPEPERQRDSPSSTVPGGPRSVENALYLRHGVRLDLLVLDLGCTSEPPAFTVIMTLVCRNREKCP